MIGKNAFATGMSVLADRFNRPLHEATLRMYYDVLAPELTDVEFSAAVTIAFRECTFWPSPKEMIEFVKPVPDLALEGSAMFDRVIELGERDAGPTYWRKEVIESQLGRAAAAAFAAIGANGRLRSIETSDLPWARREFVTAYVAAKQHETKQAKAQIAIAAGSGGLLRAGTNSDRAIPSHAGAPR